MIYVTAGSHFSDIDVFACAIAYTHFLNKKGVEAQVYLPGPLNASVTKEIKSWNLSFETTINQNTEDKFVVVDVSDPYFITKEATAENVIELFDHRYGFEEYWKNLLGEKAKIEMVGSCATLIWEEYKKSEIDINTPDANLLIIAIVSNTLDFKSSVTTERDIIAFNELEKFIDLPKSWKENYFNEQSEYVFNNPTQAILEDTKGIVKEWTFGQLELWKGKDFVDNHLEKAKEALSSLNNPKWLLSVPSISEGINYIYTENDEVKSVLESIIDIKFDGHVGKTSKLWLRKEILKKLLKLRK